MGVTSELKYYMSMYMEFFSIFPLKILMGWLIQKFLMPRYLKIKRNKSV